MKKNLFIAVRCTQLTKNQLQALVEHSVSESQSEYIRHLINREYNQVFDKPADRDPPED